MQVQFLNIDSKFKGDNMINHLARNGTSFFFLFSKISVFSLPGQFSSLHCDFVVVRTFLIVIWIFIAQIVKFIWHSRVDLSCHSDTTLLFSHFGS